MRTMYDGIASDAPIIAAIPTAIELVAGYIDGDYAWSAADWALFPNSVHVQIAVEATTNAGHVLDVETGDATPEESVNWVLNRRHDGADPTVYCSESNWPTVRAAYSTHDVDEPHWWIADYDEDPAFPAGAVAHQYESKANWDESSVVDYWPGVDEPPAPTPAAPAAAIEEDFMQQIEPTADHPGEMAYGVPAGKTRIAFVADGYDMAPAILRVVTWVGNSDMVHDNVQLGGSAKLKYATLDLPAGCDAVTVRRSDASAFPVGVYLI